MAERAVPQARAPRGAAAFALDLSVLLLAWLAAAKGAVEAGLAVLSLPSSLAFGSLLVLALAGAGLYGPDAAAPLRRQLPRLFAGGTLALAAMVFVVAVVAPAAQSGTEVARFYVFALCYLAAGRFALSRWQGGAHGSVAAATASVAEAPSPGLVEALGGRVTVLRRRDAHASPLPAGLRRSRERARVLRRALLVSELVALAAAFLLAHWLFGVGNSAAGGASRTGVLVFLAAMPGWAVAARMYGLYRRDEGNARHGLGDDFERVFHLVVVWSIVVFLVLGAVAGAGGVLDLALFVAVAAPAVLLARAIGRAQARQSDAFVQRTVVLGAGEVGQMAARKISQHPEYGLELVGFVDTDPRERAEDLEQLPVLGAPDELPTLIGLFDVERVIVAFSYESHEQTLELIRMLDQLEVRVDIVPRLFEALGPSFEAHDVGGLPLLGLPQFGLSSHARLVKRAVDVALSVAGIVALLPALALVALLIRREGPGPILFRQLRVGHGDRLFSIYKFRTMTVDADARKTEVAHLNKHLAPHSDPRMFKIPDDPRVTRIGRFLRKYSLDELPQLINVVRGDMSLVGPRPLIPEEDRHVDEWARRRLDLKPGLTGPWQVLGRNDIPFVEMQKLDYLYVTNWTLARDLKLLVETIPAVWRSRAVVY